ncbi:MAG: histone deacetylase family protein, partial [Desulfohalobiaceae bacterium]|nr:histone deacetylase family protein [Desulfohalobiaceae bacterium]
AAREACSGEPSFGLIRPPGHHASVDSCWGFCWFNNMAVAMEKMRLEQQVTKGVIIDIDLHFGDGTSNFYRSDPDIVYYHLDSARELETVLESIDECQLLGISAGFDRHVQDWGGMLTTDAYRELGRTLGDFSKRVCPGRVFALLEGGYNHRVLGECILALCRGLEV